MISAKLKITHDLDDLKNTNIYPLDQRVGELVKSGVELEVRGYGNGWVIKKGIHPEANTLEQLKQDKSDYEFFKSYIVENLPHTYHFRAVDQGGQESNYILQRKIEGKHLCELTDGELRNPILRGNLLEFLNSVERMWQEEGRIPDLSGEEGGIKLPLITDVRYCRNVLIDKNNRIWLVDTSANPLVFSKKSKTRYKHVSYLLMISVRRLKRMLKS